MNQILGLTDDPRQKISFVLDDNSTVDITLQYMANTKGWNISLVNNGFEINNNRLVNAPNLLRKYRNIISFGLSVISKDGLDPTFVDDFESERVSLFILTLDDVASTEVEFYA